MDKADIAALLAVGASFFIAIGDVVHQRTARAVTDEPVSHFDLLMRLLRDGQWWLGSVVAAVGCVLQAAALWGVFAVLTKGVVDRFDDGLWAVVRTPDIVAVAVMVAATAAGATKQPA
jgi:hypothetical protein